MLCAALCAATLLVSPAWASDEILGLPLRANYDWSENHQKTRTEGLKPYEQQLTEIAESVRLLDRSRWLLEVNKRVNVLIARIDSCLLNGEGKRVVLLRLGFSEDDIRLLHGRNLKAEVERYHVMMVAREGEDWVILDNNLIFKENKVVPPENLVGALFAPRYVVK